MALSNFIRAFALVVFAVFFVWAGSASDVKAAESTTAVVAHGTFKGASDHVTTGGVSILKTASGYVVILENDFSLDNAPAPTLGFGNGGKFDKKTDWVKLTSKKGLQVYKLPASIDPTKYDEFYVWCRKFSVPLGVAKLG